MANCRYCERDTTTAATCNVAVLHHMGRPFLLRTHAPEPGWRAFDDPCCQCGVVVGGFHHLGCSEQRCPRCDGEGMWCGCLWDEFLHIYLATGLRDDEDPDELAMLLYIAFTRFLRSLSPTSRPLSRA